jgi:DNA polymerase-4
MTVERRIMHLDMDAFFASVEQAANPEWRGRPLVVGGPGRSVVASASYEARRFGIKAGQPIGEARRLTPQLIVVPGHHKRYLWISLQILAVLRQYSPLVEPYSIDEAFVDLSEHPHSQNDPIGLARRIQAQIDAELGLSCSIGIAANKLTAKVASDFQKPGGITIVPFGREAEWLAPLAVGKLPGIGHRTTEFLGGRGIKTLGELARIDEGILFTWFGKNGQALFRMAHGDDTAPVLAELPALKSIGQEHTLTRDSGDPEELEAVLARLAGMVGRRLRAEGKEARTVTVKLRRSDFHTIARAETPGGNFCLDEEITKVAREIFRRCWDGKEIRLLGVKVSNLTGDKTELNQLPLWNDTRERRLRLAAVMDRLREKYGDKTLARAVWLEGRSGKGRKERKR